MLSYPPSYFLHCKIEQAIDLPKFVGLWGRVALLRQQLVGNRHLWDCDMFHGCAFLSFVDWNIYYFVKIVP